MRTLGVLPWFEGASRLPAEDVLDLEDQPNDAHAALKVAVPKWPRLSNFDDLDPLAAEPDVSVVFVEPGDPLPGDADLVILPGSKATIKDLAAFRAHGWDVDLHGHIRRGGLVLGFCGGFQMLGKTIADPEGVEGEPAVADGLGWLDMHTVLTGEKTLIETEGVEPRSGLSIRGYEMHVGRSEGPALERPFLELGGRPEGALSEDGRVIGCYVHGLFASDRFRSEFLTRIRTRHVSSIDYGRQVEDTLDQLADHMERHLDIDAIGRIAGI